MPLDPGIPLSVRPPSFDPMELYGRALSLRGMLQQNRIGDLQEQQLKAAMAAAPQMAQAEAAKREAEGRKVSAETVKLELDNAAARTARAGELLQGATDEVGWQAAREGITQLLGEQAPSVLGFLGPRFDPARVKSALASVTRANDFIKQKQDEWSRTHQEAELTETGRHNLATEGNTASAAARAAATQKETERHNRATEATAATAAGRSSQSQAETERHNRAMEETARNRVQGRPVLAGDAGRVAEFDTSLDDLDTLERDLGKTGTGSAIGAKLPKAVTDLTGWGADSKSRQAVIDRVKQVIGKALEGGVLRKEDEAKYERILPTIGDEPTVAASKIAGLREAITKRRATLLDALRDAGYDTSKYPAGRKRDGKIRARDPQGVLHEAAAGTALPDGWKLEP